MKTIVPVVLLSILLAVPARSAEPSKPKIAAVNLNSMMNSGNFHQRIALLASDKDTLAAMKTVVAELKAVRQEIVDAQDQAKLNDLQNKQQFLTRKLSLVMQRSTGRGARRDGQALLRDFVIATYKDKYQLIMQPDAGGPDQILWRGGVEIVDITEEATAKLREHLDELSGGSADNAVYAYPPMVPAIPAQPAKKPIPASPSKTKI